MKMRKRKRQSNVRETDEDKYERDGYVGEEYIKDENTRKKDEERYEREEHNWRERKKREI
jgi:hypothetical protein